MNQTLNQFEAARGKLFSIAYHMLGSVSDAEDTVQEAYLRYHNAAKGAPGEIRSPEAFLSTMVTRLCLNQLQSARAQRETYVGPWLPEPLITEDDMPLAQAQTEESISMAFLVLLERLTPPERAVFLLHEVFDYSFAEVAEIIGKEEATCRQIFRRARQFIVAQRPRFTPSTERHAQLLQSFMEAVGDGSLDALTRLLADDVTLWTDGGGKAKGAATRPLHGASSVARFILGSMRNYPQPVEMEFTRANGEPAIIFHAGGAPVIFIGVSIADQTIRELRVIGNPDKLRSLPHGGH